MIIPGYIVPTRTRRQNRARARGRAAGYTSGLTHRGLDAPVLLPAKPLEETEQNVGLGIGLGVGAAAAVLPGAGARAAARPLTARRGRPETAYGKRWWLVDRS